MKFVSLLEGNTVVIEYDIKKKDLLNLNDDFVLDNDDVVHLFALEISRLQQKYNEKFKVTNEII